MGCQPRCHCYAWSSVLVCPDRVLLCRWNIFLLKPSSDTDRVLLCRWNRFQLKPSSDTSEGHYSYPRGWSQVLFHCIVWCRKFLGEIPTLNATYTHSILGDKIIECLLSQQTINNPTHHSSTTLFSSRGHTHCVRPNIFNSAASL